VSPAVRAEGDAICRRAVNAVRVEVGDVNAFKPQGSRRCDRMTHRGLLHVRRYDADVTETRCRFRQRRNARAVNSVIIGNQDSHFHTLRTRAGLFLAE
jgi:hypothetical protein